MLSHASFSRAVQVEKLREQTHWDVLIIGGGATGLGCAVDAASRGYSTLLLEQHDFAKGTSSRSTKLVHGGVRYLAQGDLKLVYSALRERNLLARNARHIVRKQAFVVPCYSYFELSKYGLGLKLYDILAGRYGIGNSSLLSRKKVSEIFPAISTKGLVGGIQYFDGQFDDARLAINLAQTAVEHSAVVLNYFKVTALMKATSGKVTGVTAMDQETREHFDIAATVVINATGVFVDDILLLDEPGRKKLVSASRGVHMVIDKKHFRSSSALMIPKTSDGRVLFAVPWHDHIVIGTTDTPIEQSTLEPEVPEKELEFIMENLKKYLLVPLHKKDILSVFAGLRPLAAIATDNGHTATKELSRDHKLIIGSSGLITITGGKWTTYRKMAEETINLARDTGKLPEVRCKTAVISLHGSTKTIESEDHLSPFGLDAKAIREIIRQDQRTAEILVPEHPYTIAEVKWCVRFEMARTVEDVLARRLRLLFLDAESAIKAAPKVARIIGSELHLDEKRIREQLDDFYNIATLYKVNT
jgi:glycerol-3-phosphate dehydrogenase